MSGPFSARQVRATAQRGFNLADAAITEADALKVRVKELEESMNRVESWLVMWTRLPFWRRLRWLVLGY